MMAFKNKGYKIKDDDKFFVDTSKVNLYTTTIYY